jgi:1,2-diacylglycerol 3-alpha-glucosyltransferase
MNILFVSDVYFPRINGVSTSIRTLRRELVNMGHNVHLIAPEYHVHCDDESWITRIPSRYLFLDPEDRIMRFFHAAKKLDAIRSCNFDVIHVHTPFVGHYLGRWLSRKLALPWVETYHTFFEGYLHHYVPFAPRWLLAPIVNKISRSQCNQVNGVIVPSQPVLDVLHRYNIKTHAEVIPTGLESERFDAGKGAEFRIRFGIAPGRPVMLYVGRVAHEKNIDFLLRMTAVARKTMPDVLLVVAGEGPALEYLRRETAQLGINDNVMFVGYLDRMRELNDCYQAADVFVFSSRTETQGLVLLEAMAQGVPVVSTAELGTKSQTRLQHC